MNVVQWLKVNIANNLQLSLIILVIVCIIQFTVVIHVTQVIGNNRQESQLVNLLRVVQEQNNILKKQSNIKLPEAILNKLNGRILETPGRLAADDRPFSQCDSVHVAIVCAGYKSSRTIATLIKSILFYRRKPLHLHLVVNPVAHLILGRLLDTWAVPYLEVNFYSTETLKTEVEWIPNVHYSGQYGLMKLVIMNVLPRNLPKVIVLDTDLTFNADIGELSEFFYHFGPKQVIGLVENQSPWYLYKSHWPAVKQGFNTGVILMDLEKLRSFHWRDFWKTVAVTQLRLRNRTQLADQDIFNAVIKEAPYLCYTLPCEWNIQLNENAQSEQCYAGRGAPGTKVIHWNSFSKGRARNKDSDFFRRMYQTFVEYDGNLLRNGILGCDNSISKALGPGNGDMAFRRGSGDHCEAMRRAGSTVYRTHLFFLPYEDLQNSDEGIPRNSDVTLVTQMSLDRLLMLETLATQWNGAISVAILATDAEASSLAEFVKSSSVLRRRTNIGYHIVYKDGGISPFLYPVNYLRNVAKQEARTPFVLLADVDFVPKMKLREILVGIIQNFSLTADSKVALVLPAFETTLHRFVLPISRKLLLLLWDKDLMGPFRFSMWKAGQSPLNYTRWRTAVNPYEVKWTPYFEPYVVVSQKAPDFDTRFVGFGWNKVAHSMALHAEGYKFFVIPEAFIVHLPHSPSISNSQFRKDYKYRRCMNIFKTEFLQELEEKYSSQLMITPKP